MCFWLLQRAEQQRQQLVPWVVLHNRPQEAWQTVQWDGVSCKTCTLLLRHIHTWRCDTTVLLFHWTIKAVWTLTAFLFLSAGPSGTEKVIQSVHSYKSSVFWGKGASPHISCYINLNNNTRLLCVARLCSSTLILWTLILGLVEYFFRIWWTVMMVHVEL